MSDWRRASHLILVILQRLVVNGQPLVGFDCLVVLQKYGVADPHILACPMLSHTLLAGGVWLPYMMRAFFFGFKPPTSWPWMTCQGFLLPRTHWCSFGTWNSILNILLVHCRRFCVLWWSFPVSSRYLHSTCSIVVKMYRFCPCYSSARARHLNKWFPSAGWNGSCFTYLTCK